MKKSKNILLIVLPYMVAPTKAVISKGVRSYLAFPYGLLTVASYVKAQAATAPDLCILDLNLYALDEIPRVLDQHLASKPEIVGLSFTFDVSYKHMNAITKQIKENDSETTIVVGGPAATVSYSEILEEQEYIDAVCYSEGELALCQLADSEDIGKALELAPWVTRDSLKAGKSPTTQYVDSLDDVIAIDYSLVNIAAYSMKEAFSPYSSYKEVESIKQFFLVTSRGCPFKCVFCAEPAFHGSAMRYASIDSIIDHVEFLVDEYGMNVLTFYDDQLLLNQERAKELFRRLARFNLRIEMPNGVTVVYIDSEMARLMKEAGVDTIYLAIESGSDYVLREIIKKPLIVSKIRPTIEALQQNDIFVQAFFIIGFPGEREEDRQESLKIIKTLGLDWSLFNFATPLRGSELHRICRENGWIDEENLGIGDVDMTEYVIRAPGIDPDHITRQIYKMNLEVNFVENHRMKIGDYETAAQCFQEVVDRHPDHPFAHYYLAQAHKMMEKHPRVVDESSRRFDELVSKDPDWMAQVEMFGLNYPQANSMT
jgi:anaerobic magnesium-protoporphyrin IX monomethyl ester cyclase